MSRILWELVLGIPEKRDGAVTAKVIRDEKRALQEDLDKNPDDTILPYIMAHPDLPGSEEAWPTIF